MRAGNMTTRGTFTSWPPAFSIPASRWGLLFVEIVRLCVCLSFFLCWWFWFFSSNCDAMRVLGVYLGDAWKGI
jgi:hypothetical protein